MSIIAIISLIYLILTLFLMKQIFNLMNKNKQLKNELIEFKNLKTFKPNTNFIDRQKMLSSDERYMNNSYIADFFMCKACYDFLNNTDLAKTNPFLYNKNENENLSGRNICCLDDSIRALKNHNEKRYWHELADFIENYNSKLPVSCNEYYIFRIMFEIGNEVFN